MNHTLQVQGILNPLNLESPYPVMQESTLNRIADPGVMKSISIKKGAVGPLVNLELTLKPYKPERNPLESPGPPTLLQEGFGVQSWHIKYFETNKS